MVNPNIIIQDAICLDPKCCIIIMKILTSLFSINFKSKKFIKNKVFKDVFVDLYYGASDPSAWGYSYASKLLRGHRVTPMLRGTPGSYSSGERSLRRCGVALTYSYLIFHVFRYWLITLIMKITLLATNFSVQPNKEIIVDTNKKN
jgi:hypothetical protein